VVFPADFLASLMPILIGADSCLVSICKFFWKRQEFILWEVVILINNCSFMETLDLKDRKMNKIPSIVFVLFFF
jgi:hypothetical protein